MQHANNNAIFFILSLGVCSITSCSLSENTNQSPLSPTPIEKQSKTKEVKGTREPPLFIVTDTTVYNQYKNGKKEGLWREFDKKGRLSLEGYYKNGKADGWMKWYYEGNFAASGLMKEGKREGTWKICDVHHPKECITATFEAGQETGLWQFYHENGSIWRTQQRKNGKVISQKCWNEQGVSIPCP